MLSCPFLPTCQRLAFVEESLLIDRYVEPVRDQTPDCGDLLILTDLSRDKNIQTHTEGMSIKH